MLSFIFFKAFLIVGALMLLGGIIMIIILSMNLPPKTKYKITKMGEFVYGFLETLIILFMILFTMSYLCNFFGS